MASDRVLNAIASVYRAPGDHEGWQSVLNDIVQLVGAKTAGYMLVDKDSRSLHFSAMYGYPPEEMQALYEGGGAARRDIRVQYLENLTPGRVFREFEYVPDRQAYDANEWIRHDLAKRGVYWNMTARISTHGLWTDVVAVNRLKARGPFSDERKGDLQALLPHLSRAAELQRLVTRLNAAYGAVLAVLDMLLIGLVLLDARGRVVLANTAANQAAEESGALKIATGGALRATQEAADASLQQLIATTSSTITGNGRSDGGSFVAPGRSAGSDLLLEVMPIRDDGLPDGDSIRGVAVFVIDPGRSHVLDTSGLARIFGLSPAEGAVARALINGLKPGEIAETRHTSVGTVRGQIKTIFGKTGASSQSDLVRLAARAVPPIDRKS